MAPRQKKFLYFAVPFFFVNLALAFVSMRLSAFFTVSGLAVFGYFVTRPMGRSLAHTTCAFCDRMIIFEHEGEFCPTCHDPIHAKCMDIHRASHAPSPKAPFR